MIFSKSYVLASHNLPGDNKSYLSSWSSRYELEFKVEYPYPDKHSVGFSEFTMKSCWAKGDYNDFKGL